MEVDLSDNMLNEIPIDLFIDKYVQILRVAGKSDGHVYHDIIYQ